MQTLADYLKDHLDVSRRFRGHKGPDGGGFYPVVKDLRAFKSTAVQSFRGRISPGIVSLTIPIGAVVYVSRIAAYNLKVAPLAEYRCERPAGVFTKLRASKATVHSVTNAQGAPVTVGWSRHAGRAFPYTLGAKLKPHLGDFSLERAECDAGIHFFLTLGEALNW